MAKKIRVKHVKTEEEIAEEERLAEEAKLEEELGVQDEFQAKGFELAEWAQTHNATIMAVIGIIVVVGLAIGFKNYSSSSANMAAAADFDKGMKTYNAALGDAPALITGGKKGGESYKDENERSTEALAKFKNVTTKHAGTEVANVAQLYIGHTSMRLKDYDGAKAAYEAYLSSTDAADSLRFAALEGLAYSLEAKGDKDGAAQKLEQMVALPGTLNEDVALYKLGKLYKAQGKNDKAKEALQKLVDTHKTSPLNTKAAALLSSLKA